MQPTSDNQIIPYEEVWSVCVGKEVYELNENQLRVIKQASESGHTRLVWFKDFAISIAHISDIKLISRKPKEEIGKQLVFDESRGVAVEI